MTRLRQAYGGQAGATRPVRGPLHSAEARWGNECESSVQPQAPSLQNLIANGILESPLTFSKQTTAILPNREKFWVSNICKPASGMTLRREAKKGLPAGLLAGTSRNP
jgi:hypothetical protein